MDKVNIWELVKEIEEIKDDATSILGSIKATLVINYGPSGRAVEGLILTHDAPLSMLMNILNYYQTALVAKDEEIKRLREALRECEEKGCIPVKFDE